MRKSFRRLATWIEVTLDAAATTPEITSGSDPSLHLYSVPPMLLIEPENNNKYLYDKCQQDSLEYSFVKVLCSFEASLYLCELLYGKKNADELAEGMVINWSLDSINHTVIKN